MATVTVTLTDDGDDGGVSVVLNFGTGFDPSSEAHTLAAEMAMELQEGKPQ